MLKTKKIHTAMLPLVSSMLIAFGAIGVAQAQAPNAGGDTSPSTKQAGPQAQQGDKKAATTASSVGAQAQGQTIIQTRAAEAITTSAPQFMVNQAPIPPAAPPTVSAYGTPINYQQSSNGQQAPVGLPPVPGQQVTVQQVLQEGGLYLTPNQIREMRKVVDGMGQAAAEEASGRPPRAETSSIVASLTPGATPPVIRVYMNYPTSLVFVDSGGNPWPIENFAGGSKNLEIKRPLPKDDPDAVSASLSITPQNPTGKFTHGGITVYLKKLAIPVVVTYVGGQPVVDQRLEVRVPMRGPNSVTPISVGVGPAANPSLLSLLDGVAPQGSKPLKVSSGAGQAWSIGNGRMFVRTPWTVISPGYVSGMKSADGTNVYEMEQVTELRAINGGKIQTISIDY
jgi:intracellular multiplication protein IcmK